MNILFASSEVAPFAKTGGLGDVGAALPRALAAAGHDVRVVLPMYSRVHGPGRVFTEVLPELWLELGDVRVKVSVFESELPGTKVPVYFIRCPGLYDRPSLYGNAGDEHLRFAVLNWAALKLCQHLRFSPDIIHCNDWQTSLIPLLLRARFSWDRLFAGTRTVLTIHNLGHQGTFPASVMPQTGLADSWYLFHQDELRAGRLGFLMTGLLYANAITTVSPTYAREIQTPAQGVGLDHVLRQRADVLTGILNGIDEDEWNPATDKHLPATFSAESLAGKEVCKRVLCESARLPYRREVPVFSLVARLVWQKGIDLVQSVLPNLLRHHRFQLVVLGKGEHKYEEFFRLLQRAFPQKVHYDSRFSEPRAHLVEAGSDVFLMPSRYEPCGLNQMYSLRYGTVPLVHKTGGLADTVWQYQPSSGRGTGFVFEHFDEAGLSWAIRRALDVWGSGTAEYRTRWEALQRAGMQLPLGWKHRVGRYVEVYERARGG
ncbi:MAG: glycogen synthase [Myxococcaceae bacterium]|jgi:starch synthase|nr:glycogen synthase [Myxococcaceae bacterium]